MSGSLEAVLRTRVRRAHRARLHDNDDASGAAAVGRVFEKTGNDIPVKTRGEGPEKIFLWNRCNLLKSPESDERIQINPRESKSVWLGFPWSGLGRLWNKLVAQAPLVSEF